MAGALVTTNILNTVAAMGLSALREKIVMPRLVNRDYEEQISGAKKNATVNVSIPASITARHRSHHALRDHDCGFPCGLEARLGSVNG